MNSPTGTEYVAKPGEVEYPTLDAAVVANRGILGVCILHGTDCEVYSSECNCTPRYFALRQPRE